MEISKAKDQALPYPEIARYTCYRAFLNDFFNYKKSLRAGFSYRQFASLVGLKSPNYLQLVIQGKRNLTETTAERLAEALKLTKSEINYFTALVQLDNAQTQEEKQKAERHLFVASKKLLSKILPQEQQEVLHEWYHLLVRELVFLKDFEASGDYISRKLKNIISPTQAEESFKLLLKTGYVCLVKGHYQVSEPILDTGLDIFHHQFMQDVHAKMLKTWSQKIGELGHREQELGVLNIPLPKSKIPELQEKIRRFQDEIIGWAEALQTKGNLDEIVQVGTYLMSYGEKDS
jgi:uncharacterized protein (TIGR02147 family)